MSTFNCWSQNLNKKKNNGKNVNNDDKYADTKDTDKINKVGLMETAIYLPPGQYAFCSSI